MINIKVTGNTKELLSKLKNNQKQIAFATSVALTKTAQTMQREQYGEIKKVFDRPTAYTLNSLYVKPATKASLTAKVGIKFDTFKGTPAEKYLNPNIEGGARTTKRFERAFIAKGIMPAGYYAVPGAGAPLDSFGNVQSKFIVQILSYFQAFGQQGYAANATDKTRNRFENAQSKRVSGAKVAYFAVSVPGKRTMGIYQRIQFGLGSSIKPVFIFVKRANYKARYNFIQLSDTLARKYFPLYLAESVELTLRTQR